MITINENKLKYIDTKSVELIELVEEFINESHQEQREEISDSISNKNAITLTSAHFVDAPIRQSEVNPITYKKLSEIESYQGRKYGFNEENYIQVLKLADNVLKDTPINNLISKQFLIDKTLDWTFAAYRTNRISEAFSSYLLSEINASIKEHNILFPVDMIEILGEMQIGRSTITFMSKEYLDHLERIYIENEKNADPTYYQMMKNNYQGCVFAGIVVKAEKEKAEEIALEECSLSIDLLKICSIATIWPEYKLWFNIDKKMKGKRQSEFLIQDSEKPYFFSFDKEAIGVVHYLDKEAWQLAIDMGLQELHDFIINRQEKDCELTSMLVNSIKRYAESLSKHDLNQRIVEIFTILESLLLRDDSVPILESLSKYCPKLVSKDIDERKEIVKVIKELYGVRSSLIHHGKYRSFDVSQLSKLQIILFNLIKEMIKKITIHKTKLSLLNEIDDAIMNSY